MTGWLDDEQVIDSPTALGWARAVLRGTVLTLVVYGGLALLLLLRLVERPLFGMARPLTPYITQGVCRIALMILGLRLRVTGQPLRGRGAVVANHASWMDIFALNARKRVYFVSKAEVADWPGIGWLARATGTVFINRDPKEAKAQAARLLTDLGFEPIDVAADQHGLELQGTAPDQNGHHHQRIPARAGKPTQDAGNRAEDQRAPAAF